VKIILMFGSIIVIAICGVFVVFHCMNPEKNNKRQVMQNTLENNSTTRVSNVSISIVYDNNPYKEGLSTAWGFSCVIKGTEKTILFDTGGDGSILLSNMEKMGITTKEIDLIVISHIHGDHTGGLSSFLEKNSDVVTYLPKSFPESFKSNVRSYGTQVIEVHESVEICKNVCSTGELGIWIKEQSLIIHTDKGLIVITGCAHPGIVKIVQKAKQLVNGQVILVMGGFHLGGETRDKIEEIVMDFKNLGVRYTGPCHCSGDTARQLFEKEYQDKYIHLGVGKIVTVEDLQ